MKKNKIPVDELNEKRVLSFDELSMYTGFSKRTLYKLTSKKIIPFNKPTGKKMFFDRLKIDEWLLSKPNK